jgi:hypothetical protein
MRAREIQVGNGGSEAPWFCRAQTASRSNSRGGVGGPSPCAGRPAMSVQCTSAHGYASLGRGDWRSRLGKLLPRPLRGSSMKITAPGRRERGWPLLETLSPIIRSEHGVVPADMRPEPRGSAAARLLGVEDLAAGGMRMRLRSASLGLPNKRPRDLDPIEVRNLPTESGRHRTDRLGQKQDAHRSFKLLLQYVVAVLRAGE